MSSFLPLLLQPEKKIRIRGIKISQPMFTWKIPEGNNPDNSDELVFVTLLTIRKHSTRPISGLQFQAIIGQVS